mmetsp:Transcript_17724/g.50213  ORF Transcript_17724/g.50213 Transcript_17724/m.50213 type:complete len:240 (+) Transcript_17724:109-828(+)
MLQQQQLASQPVQVQSTPLCLRCVSVVSSHLVMIASHVACCCCWCCCPEAARDRERTEFQETLKQMTQWHQKKATDDFKSEIDAESQQPTTMQAQVRNEKDAYGNTALHRACRDGDLDKVKYLVEVVDVDVNIENNEEQTPLHHAVCNKHPEVAKYLLNVDGINLTAENEHGDTALHLAARSGCLASVQLLIKKDKGINPGNTKGVTPLDYAVRYNHPEVAEYLKRKGDKRKKNRFFWW